MKRFKELIKNKFVWGPGDIDHEKPKAVKETLAQRASKFVWEPGQLEHHDIKESLDEKITIPDDYKNNHGAPHKFVKKSSYDDDDDHHHHQIMHSSDYSHPFHKKKNISQDSHDAFSEHHDNMDDDERHSISHYKADGHAAINRHLRDAHKKFKKERKKHLDAKHKDGLKFKNEPESHKHIKAGEKKYHNHLDHDHDDEPSDDDYHEHEIDDHVYHLDNVTKHKTTEHHTVFRGGHPGDKTKFPIGHEFIDHGYSSTSFSHKTSKNFAHTYATNKAGTDYKSKKSKDHVHVIHVPKGSRGHYFDVHGEDAGHTNHHEKEFLLHRGTKFKVTHHSEDEDTHYIHTKVIKQGIRHKFNFKSKQKSGPKPKDDHGLPGQHKFPFMKHHDRFKKAD